jgi:hypothetical protein
MTLNSVVDPVRESKAREKTKNKELSNRVETDFPEEFIEEMEKSNDVLPRKIDANPKNVEKGLAKLVLALIELIRKLLEKQAMRRVEAGSLSDEEIENVGETLMKLENKMDELKGIFGLKDEELNLNLGPLGDLM